MKSQNKQLILDLNQPDAYSKEIENVLNENNIKAINDIGIMVETNKI